MHYSSAYDLFVDAAESVGVHGSMIDLTEVGEFGMVPELWMPTPEDVLRVWFEDGDERTVIVWRGTSAGVEISTSRFTGRGAEAFARLVIGLHIEQAIMSPFDTNR